MTEAKPIETRDETRPFRAHRYARSCHHTESRRTGPNLEDA